METNSSSLEKYLGMLLMKLAKMKKKNHYVHATKERKKYNFIIKNFFSHVSFYD
jgi:hypothetical protein